MLWILEPLVAVGGIEFDTPAEPYIKKYDLRLLPPIVELGEVFDWTTYEFPDCDSKIYVEAGQVTDVSCYDELLYKGRDIFGLSLDDLRIWLDPEDEIGEMIGGDTPIKYESLGIQVWLDREGFVDSVMCHGPIDDDE